MSKKLILLAVLILILVGAGVWAGMKFAQSDPNGASEYSMVTMTNGDVYFGKLSLLPGPKLTDVWLLQRTANEKNEVQVRLVPFGEVSWKPVNEMYLNKDQILSWSPIQEGSDLVKAFRDPKSAQQIGQNQLPTPPASLPAPSSTESR